MTLSPQNHHSLMFKMTIITSFMPALRLLADKSAIPLFGEEHIAWGLGSYSLWVGLRGWVPALLFPNSDSDLVNGVETGRGVHV
jgi:hypothetical protein